MSTLDENTAKHSSEQIGASCPSITKRHPVRTPHTTHGYDLPVCTICSPPTSTATGAGEMKIVGEKAVDTSGNRSLKSIEVAQELLEHDLAVIFHLFVEGIDEVALLDI
jgi:hypothetical protein